MPSPVEVPAHDVIQTSRRHGAGSHVSASAATSQGTSSPKSEPSVASVPLHPTVPTSGSAVFDESKLPDVAEAVAENEKETKAGRPSESDRWKPQKTQVASLPSPAAEAVGSAAPSVPQGRGRAPVVVEDLTQAQKAAAKMDSDNWSPQPSGPAPSDADLGLNATNEGGDFRRSVRRQHGKSYDDMVPLSDGVKRGGQGAQGSENWSPSAAAKLSAKEEQTLAMINTLKSPSPTRVTQVNRDVNNPEEGVKPFYSLEKYSGAQFGRHREFERRVIYKQNKKSSLKGYDFYIDEVDRKQEKHYLYYYKIDPSKKAKLIATEKHEQVTFLSNYDIGSEDKGKIAKE